MITPTAIYVFYTASEVIGASFSLTFKDLHCFFVVVFLIIVSTNRCTRFFQATDYCDLVSIVNFFLQDRCSVNQKWVTTVLSTEF